MSQEEIDELKYNVEDLTGRIQVLRGQIDVLYDIIHILTAANRIDPNSLITKHIRQTLSELPREKEDRDRGKLDICNRFMKP
ncbi:MAG: hypothetical protein J4F39_14105 [Candidatus Latescibacteria bacterium]|nr:hypothetical protein [Candidatus Latescibacterota bacterium]